MSAFPHYDAALLDQLDTQAAAILGVFGAKKYSRVEPPILQPADGGPIGISDIDKAALAKLRIES